MAIDSYASIRGNRTCELDYSTNRVVVFTSGYAPYMPSTYGEVPNFDCPEFDFRSIRGPITEQFLPQKTQAIPHGDGGLLVSNFIPGAKVQKGVGLMPHLSTELRFPRIKCLCEELNIKYISPRVEGDVGARMISGLDFLITEAMHGAIVADSYGVPRINITFSKGINLYKWEDYHYGVGLSKPVFFHIRPTMFEGDHREPMLRNKNLLFAAPIANWGFNSVVYRIIRFKLEEIIRATKPQAETKHAIQANIESKIHELQCILDKTMRDYQ